MNRLFALIAAALFVAPTFSANFDWPQWRGSNRAGVAKETGSNQRTVVSHCKTGTIWSDMTRLRNVIK